MGHWEFKTAKGLFRIVPHNGRFLAMHEDKHLGSYARPEQALDDLCGGHTFSTSDDIDTAECGLPDELSEWAFVRP